MQNRYFAFILLPLTVGCACLGTEVTRSNNHIQMPHYSFVVPADQGWHIQRLDKPVETAIIVVSDSGTQKEQLCTCGFPSPNATRALSSPTIRRPRLQVSSSSP